VTLPKMRFYSADHEGKYTHHDVALVESPNVPGPDRLEAVPAGSVAVNHIAMQLPDREAWLKQLEFLQSRGIKFNLARQPRRDAQASTSTTRTGTGFEFLYELPREMWETTSQGAIDYLENLPNRGTGSACRPDDSPSFGQDAASPRLGQNRPRLAGQKTVVGGAAAEPPRCTVPD